MSNRALCRIGFDVYCQFSLWKRNPLHFRPANFSPTRSRRLLAGWTQSLLLRVLVLSPHVQWVRRYGPLSPLVSAGVSSHVVVATSGVQPFSFLHAPRMCAAPGQELERGARQVRTDGFRLRDEQQPTAA